MVKVLTGRLLAAIDPSLVDDLNTPAPANTTEREISPQDAMCLKKDGEDIEDTCVLQASTLPFTITGTNVLDECGLPLPKNLDMLAVYASINADMRSEVYLYLKAVAPQTYRRIQPVIALANKASTMNDLSSYTTHLIEIKAMYLSGVEEAATPGHVWVSGKSVVDILSGRG